MVKLRTGPAISVVKSSTGLSSDPMDFYSTTYSTIYCDDSFTPRKPKAKGTGYLANFKPEISYSAGLDKLDNKEFGKIVADNYETSYTKSHRDYCTGSDGKDTLPSKILPRESGFTQQQPISFSDSQKVFRARKETLTNEVYKPLLKKISKKRVPHLDDGSLTLATETGTCYLGKPSQRMNTHLKEIGKDEPSGFTHYHHFDPVLYRPREPFNESLAYRNRMRPTGISENQSHFLHWPTLSGNENNPGIRSRAQRDTGYSYETAKPRYAKIHTSDAFTKITEVPHPVVKKVAKLDPCELVNLTDDTGHKTLANCWLKGEQRPTVDQETRLHRRSVARNETSGYSTNNGQFVRKTDDRSFETHYNVKFKSKAEYYKGEAATNGPKKTNGFTKSTTVHKFENGLPFKSTEYYKLNPHVAKVVKLEHPCYMDNTRYNKLKVPQILPKLK